MVYKDLINIENEIKNRENDIEVLSALLTVDKNNFYDAYKNIPEYSIGEVGSEKALALIGGRWKHAILMRLFKQPALRYSEIKHALETYGISDGMLSSSLKELIVDRLITKKAYPTVPVTVEYSPTQKALDLWYIILELSLWYNKYLKQELEQEIEKSK